MGTFVYNGSGSTTDEDDFKFTIHEYGDIHTGDSVCDQVGDEYNPLQDSHVTTRETRGTLDDHVVDTDDSEDEYQMSALL